MEEGGNRVETEKHTAETYMRREETEKERKASQEL